MNIAWEINKLVDIMEAKENLVIQRVRAMTSGNIGRARFIENQAYPEYGKRIRAQIATVNEIWDAEIRKEQNG